MSIRTRVLALCVLASAGTGMSAAVHAQGVEGTDYRKIEPPQPTDSPGKIEVIEFFSYMCPHCKEFYPLVSTWEAKLPKNVVFRRVPAGFGPVPTMTVNGEYQAMSKNLAEMLLNTDRLIAQAQTEAHAAGASAKHK